MNQPFSDRLLAVYSGVITAAFLYVITTGFAPAPKKTSFEEIDVKRINVIEPDGRMRLVISNKTNFPGLILKGKEYPHETRHTAVILFFNDEGTENGGISFGGMKDQNGKEISSGHMSFDKYMQDQVLSIDAGQNGAQERSALTIVDRPNYPITDLVDELARTKGMAADARSQAINTFVDAHGRPHQRLFLGRSEDKSVALRLKDTDGRDRIVIKVDPAGVPALQILDEKGNVTAQFPPKS